MSTTPVQIAAAIGVANTDLYDPFVSAGATWGMIVALHFCNTTSADITIDVFLDMATDLYLCDDKVVPAKGNLDWTGIVTVDAGTEILKGIASASGVHVLGTVMENAT